jgi:hypothetical protein
MHWRTQVALIGAALLIIFFPVPDRSTAVLLQEFTWDFPEIPWFGGISAIETADRGQSYLAITDRGIMFTGPIVRRATDQSIKGIIPRKAWGTRSETGARLPPEMRDTEALAVASDGSVYLSFEHDHRISHMRHPRAYGQVIKRPTEFDMFPRNGGIEAMAIDQNDVLYALPERFTRAGRIPVFRFRHGSWDTDLTIAATPWMRPVSADFGPDKRLYVLERGFSFTGFKTRLRRWRVTDAGLDKEETLIDAPRRSFGNLEGLDVWQDDSGGLRALIVEDNNFWPLNKTSVLDFRLPN